jgi:hypothetical protein
MIEKITLEDIGQNKLHCAGCERTIEFSLATNQTEIEKIIAELDWIGCQVVPA